MAPDGLSAVPPPSGPAPRPADASEVLKAQAALLARLRQSA